MNSKLRGCGFGRTEEYIKKFVAESRAGDIAVCIGDKSGEVYRFFSSSRGDVLNGQTVYDMMSVSKIMATTPLVYMAIEDGLISPEDKLGKYFPEAPEDKKDLPLYMMLSHQSGMGRYVNPRYFGPDSRGEAIRFQLSHPLLFKPGTGYFYSCSAYIILGFLVERVYNKPLDRLFDDRVVRPLGLKNTMFNHPEDINIARCTRKAFEGDNKCSDDNNRRLYGVSGNAGVFSCLDDMAVFGCSLLHKHNTLIGRDVFEKCSQDYTPHLSIGRALGYVYADERYTQGGGLFSPGSLGHTGFSGTACFADYEKELFVVSLTNTAMYAAKGGKDCSAECAEFRRGLHNAIKEDMEY